MSAALIATIKDELQSYSTPRGISPIPKRVRAARPAGPPRLLGRFRGAVYPRQFSQDLKRPSIPIMDSGMARPLPSERPAMPLFTGHVRARRLVRKMRGGSQAHLVEADDDRFYVVKFRNNPQGIRILINEALGSFLLQKMGIDSPAMAYVEVDDEFLAANPQISLGGKAQGATAVPRGLHFGSQYPGAADRSAVYDFLPDAMLHRLYNRPNFFGALVFDKWISNADGRQAIFFRARVTAPTGQNCCWFSQIIDNGHAFQGVDWSFRDSPVQGVYARPAIYGRHVSMLPFRPWIEIVTDFRRELLEEVSAALPVSWIADQQPELESLLREIYRRRTLVPELVQDSVRWMQRTKPGWNADFDGLTAGSGGVGVARGKTMATAHQCA